jgi:hypothetical protein
VLGESLQVEHLRAAWLQRLQPLTQQNMSDDLVDNMGRGLRNGPRAARRTETAPLATEARDLVVAALGAPQPEGTGRRNQRKASNSSLTNFGRLAPVADSTSAKKDSACFCI